MLSETRTSSEAKLRQSSVLIRLNSSNDWLISARLFPWFREIKRESESRLALLDQSFKTIRWTLNECPIFIYPNVLRIFVFHEKRDQSYCLGIRTLFFTPSNVSIIFDTSIILACACQFAQVNYYVLSDFTQAKLFSSHKPNYWLHMRHTQRFICANWYAQISLRKRFDRVNPP